MAWYSSIRRKNKADINEAPKQTRKNNPIPINKNKMNDFVVKALGNIINQYDSRERFQRPEYNLWEIKEASEADSYVKISLSKYAYLIFKAGASFKGEDERVAYIEKRFRMMSFATQKPMDILFQEIADDITTYSNAFLIKRRVDNIPGIKASPILADKVVGGYFRVDPASIKIKRDRNGNVTKYQQGYGDNVKEFFPRDVVHIYMDKDANNAFGSPRIIAALDDVKLLRKIEGNVSALVYRFSMPLYQWIVGLPQPGMQATEPEILKAQREIEMSTLDGMVVTNERTTIKAIGAEGTALSAEGYLKYFEDRCFAALGVSASQMGRGGAKQDADSMEAQIHDTVKYIQRILSVFIREKILNELLLEGGYNPILNEEDIVTYDFEEISLETKVKKENHEILKWQGNLTTSDEARRKLGMKDSVKDEERLYKNMIEKKARLAEIDRTAKHQKDLATEKNNNNSTKNGNNDTSLGNKAPRSSKGTGPNNAVDNNNRPQNQHGTFSAKIKESHELNNENHYKDFKDVYKICKDAIEDLENGEDMDLVFPLIVESLRSRIDKRVDQYSLKGITDAIEDIKQNVNSLAILPDKNISMTIFNEEVEKKIKAIMKDVKSDIVSGENNISTAFDKQEYRLKFFIDYMLRKVYWYSYVKTGALVGVNKAYIIFNSENDAKGRSDYINTKAFTVEDIPAYHSFCDCTVTFKKENKNR